MGVSTFSEERHPMTELIDAVTGERKTDGGAQEEGVYGTYVHGFFDRQEIAHAVVRGLAAKKGLDFDAAPQMDYQEYKETQYDILADTLRRHLDMDAVYRILEEGTDDED